MFCVADCSSFNIKLKQASCLLLSAGVVHATSRCMTRLRILEKRKIHNPELARCDVGERERSSSGHVLLSKSKCEREYIQRLTDRQRCMHTDLLDENALSLSKGKLCLTRGRAAPCTCSVTGTRTRRRRKIEKHREMD